MKHDNAFDTLRLIAALIVIFGHAFRLSGETGPSFAGTTIATVGVKIFFVISGYLVAQSWLRDPHPRRFLQRRLLRIVPGLALVVLLTMFVIGPAVTSLPIHAYLADQRTWLYLANLVFYPADELPGVFAANIAPREVNGSLWSLPPELSMYLLLPVLASVSLALSGAYRLFVLAACLVTLCSLLVILPSPEWRAWTIYGTALWAWFAVAPFFLLGACYAFCGWDRYLNRAVAAGLLALLVVMPATAVVTELLLIVALPYVVLAFGTAAVPFGGALTQTGDYSYGLYLYAFPIQQALVAAGAPGGALGNFTLAALLAGDCAIVSWHLIERPALRAKPAGTNGERPRAALEQARAA